MLFKFRSLAALSIFTLAVFLTDKTQAQSGITAVPFLQITASTEANAMAGSYTPFITDDPSAFQLNPAQLGAFANKNNFAAQNLPGEVDWLPPHDLKLQNHVIAAGINLEDIYSHVPLSIGIGYARKHLDLGEQIRTSVDGSPIDSFNSRETSELVSIGLHLDWFIDIYLGFGKKSIHSKIAPVGTRVAGHYVPEDSGQGSANDWGFILSYPFQHRSLSGSISVGHALLNNGRKISYFGNRGDPLPKMLKTGYSLKAAYHSDFEGYATKYVEIGWSHEVRDILAEAKYDSNGEFIQTGYVNWPGDISITDNLLLGKSTNYNDIHQGWKISLLDETFSYSGGRFWGEGWNKQNWTTGFTIDSRFLSRFAADRVSSPTLKKAMHILSFSYTYSRIDSKSLLNNTVFQGLTIKVHGF